MLNDRSESLAFLSLDQTLLSGGLFMARLILLTKASTLHHCGDHKGLQTLPDASSGPRITNLEVNKYKEKDGIPTLKGDGRRSTMVMC